MTEPPPFVLTESQFREAMETSAIGTALVSLDGRWLYSNAAVTALLGYTTDELNSLTFQELTHPDDLGADLGQLQHLLDGKIASYKMDKRYIHREGGVVWAHLSVALVRDASGVAQYFISQIQDISARKADERERERLTQRLTLAAKAGQVGIWEWDQGTVRLLWDAQMLALFGIDEPPNAIKPATFEHALHPDDRARVMAEIEECRLGLRPLDTEARVVWPSGEVRNIQIMGDLAPDRHSRMIGAAWDITESHRLTEQAQAANAAKSNFLASMSHEIRTPLNGVLGMAQAMAREPLSPAQAERLEVIQESGAALLTILNDILDLSKIEAGRIDLEAVDFDLEEVITSCHRSFTQAAQGKGLAYDLNIEGLSGLYRGDPTRVRQVFSNLISNALKFTDTGSISVHAWAWDGGFTVEVRDTGCGIAANAMERLFTKFTQADASTTRKHGGTGLGLAISRELAQIMGGTVTATSTLGEGSTFTATFPMARVGDRACGEALAPAAPAVVRDGELKVLAADDNAVNQLVLRTLLQQAGIDPVIVANGHEALEAWGSGDWSVILMDVQMPVMDGLEATRLIRMREAAGHRARTPIIALTANVMPHQIAQYADAGMDGFVAKPISPRALFEALDAVLANPDNESAHDAAVA